MCYATRPGPSLQNLLSPFNDLRDSPATLIFVSSLSKILASARSAGAPCVANEGMVVRSR